MPPGLTYIIQFFQQFKDEILIEIRRTGPLLTGYPHGIQTSCTAPVEPSPSFQENDTVKLGKFTYSKEEIDHVAHSSMDSLLSLYLAAGYDLCTEIQRKDKNGKSHRYKITFSEVEP